MKASKQKELICGVSQRNLGDLFLIAPVYRTGILTFTSTRTRPGRRRLAVADRGRGRDGRRAAPVRARQTARALAVRPRQTVSPITPVALPTDPIPNPWFRTRRCTHRRLPSSRTDILYPPPASARSHPLLRPASPPSRSRTARPRPPCPARTTPESMSSPCGKSPSRPACAA